MIIDSTTDKSTSSVQRPLDKEMEQAAIGIGIPPCPGILLELFAEAQKEDPDFAAIEKLIARDVNLSAALLKTINSPFYGLRNKISSVKQAISLLGMNMITRMVAGLVMRDVFTGANKGAMDAFWDTSAKLAYATSYIAKQVMGLNREDAYTYGLFVNCGIPILLQRFPDYKKTLTAASGTSERKFTDIEDEFHNSDHATVGSLLTKSWNLPEHICSAVKFHHEYTMLSDSQKLSHESKNLVALGLIAENIVQRCFDSESTLEWKKGGELAKAQLQLTDLEYQDIRDDLIAFLECDGYRC